MRTCSFWMAGWIAVCLLCVPASAFAQDRTATGTEPIVASDLLKIRQIEDVELSPDGRFVAYTVKRIVETPEDERPYAYRTQLYLVPANGSEPPRALTRGSASATQPAWHPDSDRIAFVRQADDDKAQIFVISLTGGEAVQLTEYEHGAADPVWSPNGSRLLFSASLPMKAVRAMMKDDPAWPLERPGRSPQDTVITPPQDTLVVLRDSVRFTPLDTLDVSASEQIAARSDSLGALRDTIFVDRTEGTGADPDGSLAQVRKWLAKQSRENNPRVFNRLDFQGEFDLQPDLSFRHIFVVDAPDDLFEADAPVAEARPVTRGYYSFGSPVWLSDNNQIVVSGAIHPDQHPDRVQDSDLFITRVGSDDVRRLLNLEHYAIYNPRLTPDGTALAFLASDLRDQGYAQTELGLFNLDGRSAPQLLTLGFDRSVSAPRWSSDGWYLYMTAPSDGGFPLYRMTPFAEADSGAADTSAPAQSTSGDPDDAGTYTIAEEGQPRPEVERLTAYTRGVRAYDVSDATIVYALTEVSNPYELYANTVSFNNERRLTEHNASWLANKAISYPDSFTVTQDSFTIDGWVMRPPNAEEGRTYPLMVEMHGGPMAMWGPGEATMWHEFQLLAARGYGVVYGNQRGSGGYGRAFKKANYQDWGTGPGSDVLAVADYAAALPWVDGDQQVLTGGSYAGYLTAWLVSQTDRFNAAVAQRGVYDLPVFFGEGNAWRLVPWHFGGYPWEGDVPPPIGDSTAAAASDTSANGLMPRAALIRNSPITYANDINTPLLIMHADNDLRTGVIQSEMLYKSLKVLGRPVEYVRYPDAGHDLSRTGDPQQRIDRLLRIYEFMERYVQHEGTQPGPTTDAR